jgi:peroxiredoxin Q/BCP
LGANESQLSVGDEAPKFSLPDQDGRIARLDDYHGRNVVLFFYPRNHTPGCTREACGFRDQYAAFQETGTAVIGISDDSPESHLRFAQRHQLPYRLLSDEDREVARSYGVRRIMGILPGRITFVINGNGIVRNAFSSHFQLNRHISESLANLE